MHHSEDILDMHLAGLIEGTARMILDEEKDVRKGALKLLSFILTQVKHFENCICFFGNRTKEIQTFPLDRILRQSIPVTSWP
jgi:hypothetical protein